MTNLTEQWKKGELPSGMYYIEFKDGDISKDVYAFGSWGNINEHFLKQVLAPVPSYEEWQASENYIDYLKQCISVYESKDKQATETSIAYNELLEENTKLKELLKECREILDYAKDFAYHDPCSKCITKIDQVLGEDKWNTKKDF